VKVAHAISLTYANISSHTSFLFGDETLHILMCNLKLNAVPKHTCNCTKTGYAKVPSILHFFTFSTKPVLTATGFVNGKGQFSTSHRIDTPQPITKQFVTGDNVGDPYGCAKLGAYPYTGGFWADG